jgi:DNA-binding CsgD family transcriptional regulator
MTSFGKYGVMEMDIAEISAATITEREREVLRWVSIGKSKSQIADILMVSESCVKRHCESISMKLGTNTLAYAVAKSLKIGIIDFP